MKPTNSIQAPMQTKLVASVTAAPTGTLVTTSSALNIQDGQVGILDTDLDSATYGQFTGTPTGKTVKLVQGTPMSNNTNNVDGWGVSDPALVETDNIAKENVRSTTTTDYNSGAYSISFFGPTVTPVANSDYGMIVELDGRRQEREFGVNTDQPSSVITMPSTLPAAPIDYVLQGFAKRLNQSSMLLNHNKRYVVLGINKAGGAGTALSALANDNSAIDFMVQDGVTYTMQSTTPLIRGLANLIAATGDVTGASTIEVLGSVEAGSATTVDALLVVGLDDKLAAYEDDVFQVRTDITVNPKDEYEGEAVVKVYAQEGENSGRALTLENRHRAQLNIHTKQLTPMGEYFSEGYSYIDSSKNYGSYIVSYYDTERTVDHRYVYEKQFTVLWEQTEPTNLTVANIGAFAPTETVPAVVAQVEAWV